MRIVRDNKKKAFTLIELLLVIAVISIIAALGLMTYRRHFITTRLDKVSIGMQHVLEAAMAYHVDKGEWPDARDCDSDASDTSDFVTDYLPNANYRSNFGDDFCWSDAGGDPTTSSNNKPLFWVAVKVPDTKDSNNPVANRLAARLPNAILTSAPTTDVNLAPACDEDNCYVRAEITVPGASSNSASNNGMDLTAVGTCQANQVVSSSTGSTCSGATTADTTAGQAYQITFNACPAGKTPQLIVEPNFIQLPNSPAGYPIVSMKADGQDIGTTGSACTSTPDASNHETCYGSVSVTVCAAGNSPDHCNVIDIRDRGGLEGMNYLVGCVTAAGGQNA